MLSLNYATDSITSVWEKPRGYYPQHVHINYVRIGELADMIAPQGFVVPAWNKPDGIYPEHTRAFITHLFYLSAVNAAFTHFEPPYAKYALSAPEYASGSLACSAAFLRGFAGASRPSRLTNKILKTTRSVAKTAEFFRGVNDIPLVEDRARNLYHAAIVLRAKYQSDARNLLEEADWRAFAHEGKPGIVELLEGDFDFVFRDQEGIILSSGAAHTVKFLKRAQLFPLMLYGRAKAGSGGMPLIRDVERLGPLAGYQAPNWLRHEGALMYSKPLAEQIDSRKEIPSGSAEEIELRMAYVVAMVELRARINKFLPQAPITEPEIDFKAWSLGRKAKTFPHHLTRTMAY